MKDAPSRCPVPLYQMQCNAYSEAETPIWLSPQQSIRCMKHFRLRDAGWMFKPAEYLIPVGIFIHCHVQAATRHYNLRSVTSAIDYNQKILKAIESALIGGSTWAHSRNSLSSAESSSKAASRTRQLGKIGRMQQVSSMHAAWVGHGSSALPRLLPRILDRK